MAINGPHIIPDAGKSFLSAFEVADRSARDYQRLQMEQQRMEENAVQRARENKANDFKLMLAALGQQNQMEQQAINNRQQDFSNQTSRFSAESGRIGALASMERSRNVAKYNGDPLGLGDEMDGYSSPTSTTSPGFSFGGLTAEDGNWGESDATVFGGPNDPDDNGESAFGGKTGPGGREGVAIPQKILEQTFGNDRSVWEKAKVEVTTRDGRTEILTIADLGTAERIWTSRGKSVLDLTEGAVSQLGGQTIYDSRGKLKAVKGIDIANVRILSENGDVQSTINQSPPDLSGAERAVPVPEVVEEVTSAEMLDSFTGGNTPPPQDDFVGPPAPSSGEEALLPPPQLARVPSFSEVDVSEPARQKLFELHNLNAELTKKSALASASATRTAAAMKNVRDPALREKYRERLAAETAEATTSAANALEAKYRAINSGKTAEVLQKRQDELGTLTGLDDVLPAADRQKLLEESSDTKTGGIADRKIAALKAYDQIRQQRNFSYKSNGYKTAEKVASAGLELATDDAKKDLAAAQKVATFRNLIEQNKANGGEKDPKIVEEWEKQVNTNLAGEVMWNERMKKFESAVIADMRPDGTQKPAAEAPVAAPAAPAAKLPEVAPPDGNTSMPDKPESWTAIKQKFISENPDLLKMIDTIAKVEPAKRESALKAVLGKKAGQRFTKVDRPGALDGVDGLEIATNIMFDQMRKSQASGWKIEKIEE